MAGNYSASLFGAAASWGLLLAETYRDRKGSGVFEDLQPFWGRHGTPLDSSTTEFAAQIHVSVRGMLPTSSSYTDSLR